MDANILHSLWIRAVTASLSEQDIAFMYKTALPEGKEEGTFDCLRRSLWGERLLGTNNPHVFSSIFQKASAKCFCCVRWFGLSC